MTFKRLAEYFQKLERTSSRLKMMKILGQLFRQADPRVVDKICYLALGRLGPSYKTIEFQIAEKMMGQAIAVAFGKDIKKVWKLYKKMGDLGEVGMKVQSSKFPPEARLARGGKVQSSKLSVLDVYLRLQEIARESGEGSVERKIAQMAKLLNSLDSLSVKYAARIPLGRLRLGFSDLTMIDGLSYMIAGDKSLSEEIRRAYEVRADVGWVAKKIKGAKGIKGIKGIRPRVGVPVMPALCQRVGTAEEMIEKVGEKEGLVAVEPKFDGTRLQIHRMRMKNGKWEVRIFTRNLENVSHMFPELVEAVKSLGAGRFKGGGLILDSEAIGVDSRTGKFLPFQETIKRKRKHGVQEALLEIPLRYYCFDILYFRGKSCLGEPFAKRRKLLEKVLGGKGGKEDKRGVVRLTPQKMVDNPQDLRKIHNEFLAQGLEGAVIKNWQAGYDPGRRGFTWVKFKQEETKKGGGLADTIDCLVMGYYKGRGKRAAFGIGAFLVGILKAAKQQSSKAAKKEGFEGYVTISKIGTGLTDEQWKKLKVKSEKLKVKDKPKEYLVNKNLASDVWLSPGIVVEIEADNITKSPTHSAGLALRFPRLKKFRDDKGPDEVTTVEEVKRLYGLQFG